MPEMGTKTNYAFPSWRSQSHPVQAECLGGCYRISWAASGGQVLGAGWAVGFFARDHVGSSSTEHAILFLGVLTVCYFYDNYVLQVYRRPMFDVAIYETMTPFYTFHLKVLKRMTHFLL